MFGQLPFDILLCMLQDRQRPLWPVWVMMLPMIVGIVFCIVTCSDTIMPMLRIYLLLMGIGLLIYMVREVRRYGRWLRDNYVDLEHKEVWQSFLVLAVIQQLASDSGYRSYSTFSLAFKQRMGQTVTAWMRELAES